MRWEDNQMTIQQAVRLYRQNRDAAVVREAIRQAWNQPGSTVASIMKLAELELLAEGCNPRLVIAQSWL
jgi:hypothetical protein